MSETVTIEMPDGLARDARALAAMTNRRLEEALLDWIGRAVVEIPMEAIANEPLLSLCDTQLDEEAQAELSGLLARQGEGSLDSESLKRLEGLMRDYRRGLVLKARALKEAEGRGLMPPLTEDAA